MRTVSSPFVAYCLLPGRSWLVCRTGITKAEEPKAAKEEPKAAKAKAETKPPPAEEKTGAFSLGAESLEEFFGLTKKPRLVSEAKRG